MTTGRESRLTSRPFVARTVDIPDGDAGTFATVQAMRALANSRSAHPAIRTLATSIVGPGSSPPMQVTRLRAWLTAHIRFLADPDTTELVHDPVLLSQWIEDTHVIGVDCDDVATLGAALGKAIGLPARFVVVGFFDPAAPLTHIWVELFDGQRWRELDTTRTAQGIGEDDRISRRVFVDVATGQQEGQSMEVIRNSRRIGVIPGARRQYLAPRRQASSLGVVPIVATIIASAPSFINAMGNLLHPATEPARIDANSKAEQLAMQGNGAALEFLRCRSVQNVVCGNIPGYGDIGGWATATARADALRRYNNVLSSGATTGGGTTNIQTPLGGASINNTTLLIAAAAAAFFIFRR